MTLTDLVEPVILGAGPVGRAIAGELSDLGHEPRLVSRSGTAVQGAKSVAADIVDVDTVARVIGRADVIFHCAQPAYHRWPQDFPQLQQAVLGLAERVGAVVVAIENTYPYGKALGEMTEATRFAPVSVKGEVRARLATELTQAHEAGRVQTAAVRASDFFGPHVVASAYGGRLFRPVLAGKRAEILGNPDARHSVTFVPDIAQAMVTIARRSDLWGRAWHAPTASAISQRAFVELVGAAVGHEASFRALSRWHLRLAGLFMKAANETLEMFYEFEHDYIVDSNATEVELRLRPTALPAAVAATVEWFRGGELG